MSSSDSRVIEAAVRTLSDNAELKLAATKRLVKTNVEHSEEAIARWDAVDAKSPRPPAGGCRGESSR
jgi:hypothetical protein